MNWLFHESLNWLHFGLWFMALHAGKPLHLTAYLMTLWLEFTLTSNLWLCMLKCHYAWLLLWIACLMTPWLDLLWFLTYGLVCWRAVTFGLSYELLVSWFFDLTYFGFELVALHVKELLDLTFFMNCLPHDFLTWLPFPINSWSVMAWNFPSFGFCSNFCLDRHFWFLI